MLIAGGALWLWLAPETSAGLALLALAVAIEMFGRILQLPQPPDHPTTKGSE